MALVMLVVLIGLVWGLRPRPASAAVILARASEVRGDASVFGLNSFVGHIEGQGMDDGGVQPYSYTFDKDVQFQAPASVRVDECVVPADRSPQCHMVVSDGATGWLYLGDQQKAWRFTAAGAGGITFVAADQRSLVTTSNGQPSVRLLGTETIVGRPAYVLEVASAAGQTTGVRDEKIWIDQQYYLELRHETRDQQGKLITAWHYTRFEPNPPLDQSGFSFNPPDGVVVEEGYPLNVNTLYITPELRFVVQGQTP
jgi:outer membrane lipoprotein-sorting protein